MNLNKLQPFIKASQSSRNLKVKTAADTLADQMMKAEQAEEVAQPTLKSQESGEGLNNPVKDEVDQLIGTTFMPDITESKPDASQFGKAASAYASDIMIGDLPKDTQEDIFKFAPNADKKTKVVQYGMTVPELIPKVDHHNFNLALKHINTDLAKYGKRSLADKFQGKIDNKYILLMNDSIIDGHHYLSMAKTLGISCSLKVLDLTPIRFQIKKAASLFEYVIHNNRRQTAA